VIEKLRLAGMRPLLSMTPIWMAQANKVPPLRGTSLAVPPTYPARDDLEYNPGIRTSQMEAWSWPQ